MLGKVLMIGVIGAVAYGASRMLKAPAGTVESGASKAAAALREKAPGVVEKVAQGTEQLGRATEKGAQKLRELSNTEDAEPSDIEDGDSTSPSDTDAGAPAG